MQETQTAFLRLVTIMNELREKCPWDRKQTIQSLRHLTIEETYELAEAISESSWQNIKEELGDLLLHIVFYSKIGTEENQFTLDEVINGVCEKLINRHPHIYSDMHVDNADDVKQNWEKIKLAEGKKSVLGGVPKSLPSMVKAMRLQDKSRQVGFEWDSTLQVWEKVQEEIGELKHAMDGGNKTEMEDELGDVFFSLVNLSRYLNIDAENALEHTNKKFISRFTKMETAAAENNKFLHDMTLPEMDALWDQIKKERSGKGPANL